MAARPTEETCAEAMRVALTSGLLRKQVAADFGIGFSTLSVGYSKIDATLRNRPASLVSSARSPSCGKKTACFGRRGGC